METRFVFTSDLKVHNLGLSAEKLLEGNRKAHTGICLQTILRAIVLKLFVITQLYPATRLSGLPIKFTSARCKNCFLGLARLFTMVSSKVIAFPVTTLAIWLEDVNGPS